MCFVIAAILAILAFNAFMAQNMAVGALSATGSIFFIGLMVRNIVSVRNDRQEKSDKTAADTEKEQDQESRK